MDCLAPISQTFTFSKNIKFSDQVNELQYIHNVKNGSVGAQMKRVIDLLRDKKQALDLDQINRDCFIDLKANKVVFNSLKNNPVITYDGLRFSYKPPEPKSVDTFACLNDPRFTINVDDDLKNMFHDIVLPDMIDIEKELQKNGMKPSTNPLKRARASGFFHAKVDTKKKKEPRMNKRQKNITNKHLLDLVFS